MILADAPEPMEALCNVPMGVPVYLWTIDPDTQRPVRSSLTYIRRPPGRWIGPGGAEYVDRRHPEALPSSPFVVGWNRAPYPLVPAGDPSSLTDAPF